MRVGRSVAWMVCALMPAMASASESVTYSYDALGRLVAVSNAGGPRNGVSIGLQYDPAGNRSSLTVDQPPPIPETAVVFSLSGPGAVTKGAPANFVIAKTGPAAVNVSLNYGTADGSAVSPTHYTGQSGTLVFQPWETQKTISIATIDDGAASPSRQFSMSISGPSTGGTVSTGSATATINASVGTAPIANPDSLQVPTCGTKFVNVIANDTDPSGNYPLTVIAVSGGSRGTPAIVNASTVSFHAFGVPGGDNIYYTVKNSAGKTAVGRVDISVVDLGGCN